jgi:small-conductance mechanosensitive channel
MDFNIGPAIVAIQQMVFGFIHRLPYLIIALAVVIGFFIMAGLVRDVIASIAKRRRKHRSVGLVLGRVAQGLVILLGLLIAMTIALPSFKPAQLIQLLGIGSVAVGFAFKDIFQNFFAGILILLTEPFRIGDQIIIDKFEGTVEDIQTRATTIRTYDGRRVVIPNANLFNQSVTVNTAFDKRRDQYDIGIGYGDDVEHARAVILEVLKSVDIVLDDPAPQVLVVDLAGSWVTLRARWWVTPPMRSEVMASRDAVLTALKKRLTDEGIDLPYPTQQILFHDQTEEVDGDRARQREGWPGKLGETYRSRAAVRADASLDAQTPSKTPETAAPR